MYEIIVKEKGLGLNAGKGIEGQTKRHKSKIRVTFKGDFRNEVSLFVYRNKT